MLCVGADILLDLDDKLAGRCNHEGADSPGGAGGKDREDRQGEGGGLTGTGLGDPDQVTTLEDKGNRRRLDRGRFGVTRLLDGFQNGGIKAEGAEGHGWRKGGNQDA